jgi:glucose/arabinose dehydrogenase
MSPNTTRRTRLVAGLAVVTLAVAAVAGGTAAASRPIVAPPSVTLTPVAEVDSPVDLAWRAGDDGLYVVGQSGQITRLGGEAPAVVLDVDDLTDSGGERGLLGLAFHPDFQANGRFYVYYSAPTSGGADHVNRLSEFRVSDDPEVADPGSERIVLEFDQPQPNHSGGAFGFGPDGFLYLGTGDGGGRGDADEGHSPQGNAQDAQKLNGKVLRLDVDGEEPYAIPPDNPFAGGGGRQEIFADGFRNPWRLSWEPAGERRLLVSDVGYGRYEEIDAVVSGGNYGWRIREGAHCLDIDAPLETVTDCPTESADGRPLVDPIVEYSHRDVGLAVVGGYVYRGTSLRDLAGRYVFADYSADWTTTEPDPRGSLLVADPTTVPQGPWPWRRLTVVDDPLEHLFVTGMGEDATGELYVMARRIFGPIGRTGHVFRVVPPVS